MNRGHADRHALLFHRFERRLGRLHLAAFFDERGDVGIACRGSDRQRVFRGDRHVRDAHDRVGARREYAQVLSLALHLEGQFDTF